MLVPGILAILGASTLAAATTAQPAVTPFLTGAAPTTLIPVTLSSSTTSAASKSSASTSAASSLSTSASVSTVTSRSAKTVTVTLRPSKTNTYAECGGLRPTPKPCPASFECIDNPFVTGCGLACDKPGICVVPIMCGGIAAIKCPDGKICVDDPRDDCHPKEGGADCSGLCL